MDQLEKMFQSEYPSSCIIINTPKYSIAIKDADEYGVCECAILVKKIQIARGNIDAENVLRPASIKNRIKKIPIKTLWHYSPRDIIDRTCKMPVNHRKNKKNSC